MKLLAKAKNARGPLSPEATRKIRAYLLNPTAAGWTDIRCLVIRWDGPVNTIWQALVAHDPRWQGAGISPTDDKDGGSAAQVLPDPITVAHAIRAALDSTE